MNRNTSLAPLLRLAATLLIAGSMVPIRAQDTHTTETFTDYLDLVIPASDSCSGEDVYIFGPLEGIAQATIDASGGIHSIVHFTPHVTAIGLTSGDTYRAVGPAQIVMNMSGPYQTMLALVDIIRVTSPGSVGNLTLTHTMHITVDASGETTVEFNSLTAACRG
jgi:hypothetical protein